MYLSFALVGACLFCFEGLGGPVMAPPAFNCWRLYRREECVYVYMCMYVWREGKGVYCVHSSRNFTHLSTHTSLPIRTHPQANRKLWSSARQLLFEGALMRWHGHLKSLVRWNMSCPLTQSLSQFDPQSTMHVPCCKFLEPGSFLPCVDRL